MCLPIFVDVNFDMEITRFYVSSPDQTLRYVATIRYLSLLTSYVRHIVTNIIPARASLPVKLRSRTVLAMLTSIRD